MAVVRNLLVRAGADFSELQKEMVKAQKFMKTASKDIGKIGKTLTLGITAPLVGIGAAGVKLASDLKEVQNVVDTAFGDSAKDVDAWAKTAIESYGLSELSAKQFAGTMRAMVGSMGLSSDVADEMAMSLSSLSGDMASFYNLDPTEAFEKLRAGIAGETEPLKALGINMSVANMEAYALTQGIEKSWKEMSAAEQATLRYNYIMEATKDAQGDFAKTNTGFANSMRVVKEQLKSIAAQFGNLLLPALEKGLEKVREWLTAIQNLSPEMQKKILLIAGVAAAIGPLLMMIGKMLSIGSSVIAWGKGISAALMAVKAGTAGVGSIMTAVFGPAGIVLLVIAGIAALVAGFMHLWKTNEDFRNFFIEIWNSIVEFITPILEYLKTVIMQCWEDVCTVVTPILERIKTLITDAWNWILTTIVPILNNIWDTIKTIWDYIVKTVTPILELLKTLISAAWEFILTFVGFIMDNLASKIETGFEIIKGIFSIITEAIKLIWNIFGDSIVDKIKIVWDTIAGVFKGASTVLTGIFQVLTGLLTGNWEKCWQGISNIVSGVWNGIVAFVKGGINMLISSLNFFIRGLNKIKVPDWIPGIGGLGINISEIPMLAKGTDYFQGGLAIVGEEGPELVSMPRGASVTPNGETMDMLGGLNLNISNFYNNRQQDIEGLAEELAFYMKRKKMSVGGGY